MITTRLSHRKHFTYILMLLTKSYVDDAGQEHVLSFEKLDKVTNQLARALRKYDKFETTSSSPQSFVAVCVRPSDRLPIVLLAILKAGMAYLPLDTEFPMSRVKHILEEAQPLMVLTEEGGEREREREPVLFLSTVISSSALFHSIHRFIVFTAYLICRCCYQQRPNFHH